MQQNINMKKNVLWNTIGSVYYSFCQWLMTVIIVYLTSDFETIGVLGLTMTVTNSFTTISSFGMRSFQVSDLQNQYSNEDYIMSRRISAFVAYLLCLFYALAIGCDRNELISIMIYMLLRLVESTEDVYQGVLQKNWRFDVIGKSYLIRGTLQILMFVLVFYVTESLPYTFAAMFLSNFAVFIFYDVYNTNKIAKISGIKWNREILNLYKCCSILVIFNFAMSSLSTIVRVGLRDILGQECLGIYSTIASPTVIIQLVASVVFSPFIPYFTEVYIKKDEKRFKKYIINSVAIFGASFVIISVLGLLFGKLALSILYNEEIAENYQLLLPLLWCTFFIACVWFLADILIAIRKTKILLIGAIVSLLINFIQNKYFILYFGANGASYSQIVVEALMIVSFFALVCKEIRKLGD